MATELLSSASGLPIGKIKSAMQKGAVWLTDNKGTQRLRRVKKPLHAGSTVHMYYDESVLAEQISAPIQIADEASYSVWYKPRGVLSQGSKWGDHCTLSRWVELHDEKQRPALIVHRLDRAASGLMLLAHGKNTARLLANLFQTNSIKKEYRAIVHGRFPESDEPVLFDSPVDGRSALSRVMLLSANTHSNRSLLNVQIDTGRKHQIRRHLSSAGFPIVGDRLHGLDSNGELQLCAVLLCFRCPLNDKERRYELREDLSPGFTPRL